MFVADQIGSTYPTFVSNLSVICDLSRVGPSHGFLKDVYPSRARHEGHQSSFSGSLSLSSLVGSRLTRFDSDGFYQSPNPTNNEIKHAALRNKFNQTEAIQPNEGNFSCTNFAAQSLFIVLQLNRSRYKTWTGTTRISR